MRYARLDYLFLWCRMLFILFFPSTILSSTKKDSSSSNPCSLLFPPNSTRLISSWIKTRVPWSCPAHSGICAHHSSRRKCLLRFSDNFACETHSTWKKCYFLDFSCENEGEGGLPEVVDIVGLYQNVLDYLGWVGANFLQNVIKKALHLLPALAISDIELHFVSLVDYRI